MISAINSYGQNKVKVQKQNFGHVPTWVTKSCSKAHKYLVQVQGRPEIFEKGKDEVVLDARIQEAYKIGEPAAAYYLKEVKKFVGNLQPV